MLKKYIPKLIKNEKLTEIKNELITGIIKLKKFLKIKKQIKIIKRSWYSNEPNINKYNK